MYFVLATYANQADFARGPGCESGEGKVAHLHGAGPKGETVRRLRPGHGPDTRNQRSD